MSFLCCVLYQKRTYRGLLLDNTPSVDSLFSAPKDLPCLLSATDIFILNKQGVLSKAIRNLPNN